jgi:hypothetical protein
MSAFGDRSRPRAADDPDNDAATGLRMRGPRGDPARGDPARSDPPRGDAAAAASRPSAPAVLLRRQRADNPGTLAPGPRPHYPLGRAAWERDPGDTILVGVGLLPALAVAVWALLSLPTLDEILPAAGSVATAPVIREPGG